MFMKYKIGLLIFFLFSQCTQTLISYVKTPHPIQLLTAEQMFLTSGLINPITVKEKSSITQQNYSTGQLAQPHQELEQKFNTLQVEINTPFEIKVNTKNYLIANPFYSSEGIIYQADLSTPKQGKFIFIADTNYGEIRIRIYSKEGILQRESIWYIETKSTN